MLLVRGILPSIKITVIVFIVLFASGPLWAADKSGPMTLEKFREITSRPPDNVPLKSKLAKIPLWTNTVTKVVVTNLMPIGYGEVSNFVFHGKSHTVEGKYIVTSTDSQSKQGPEMVY